MSSSAKSGGDEHDIITDQEPTGNTPAHGSSNEIFNRAGGNRVDRDGEEPGTLDK